MKRIRGYTMIETAVAFALLTLAVAVASHYTHLFRVHEAQLWEEFCAHELALSVLDDLRTQPPPPPGAAQPHTLSGPLLDKLKLTLPDAQVAVTVSAVAGDAALREARVEVSWTTANPHGPPRATLVRTALLRGAP